MDALKEHNIPFSGLSDGSHDFQFEVGQAFFEAAGDEAFEGGDVRVEVRLDKTPTMLITNIHVEGPVAVRCHHCNAPMELLLKGDQRQIFQLFGESDPDDDELVVLDDKAHSINLTHYIYECLELALPARHVHEPGDCDPEVDAAFERIRGDQEPEPDPRWEVLKTLKDKKN